MNTIKINAQVVVLGAGPAGYSAAFRCADLGLETVIIERYENLGGTCLNVGCIPSKTLLHISKVIEEAKELDKHGICFDKPEINLGKIRTWKNKIINQLSSGLANMAKIRNVKVINGICRFIGTRLVEVDGKNNSKTLINFDNAIIASGSRPIQLPFVSYQDSRIWDSTSALKLKKIPKNMLIIGGGIIGLEIGTIYHALGSKIDIVEVCNQIIPAADKDIINIYTKCINKKFDIMLETKVVSIESKEEGIYVYMENNSTKQKCYDVVLIAVGRVPNTEDLGLNKVGVKIDDKGFICVDKQLRTNIANIFAVGDVVCQPMLAHKGVYEGRIAAEVIAGMNHYFDPKSIPSIAYTEPEIAWVGLTEREAKEKGIDFKVATFSWSNSGRAIASNCSNGMTKLIFDKNTHTIIGGAVVGSNGGELLGEIGLAIEMNCDAEDIALTIHAHPTLYESIGLAAEIFEGTITDLPNH